MLFVISEERTADMVADGEVQQISGLSFHILPCTSLHRVHLPPSHSPPKKTYKGFVSHGGNPNNAKLDHFSIGLAMLTWRSPILRNSHITVNPAHHLTAIFCSFRWRQSPARRATPWTRNDGLSASASFRAGGAGIGAGLGAGATPQTPRCHLGCVRCRGPRNDMGR